VGIKLPYIQKANPESAHHQMKAVDPSWILHAGEVCFGAQNMRNFLFMPMVIVSILSRKWILV